ncbi:hypothetical protein [uncultured Acetobacteroides sp.]|uniref:hypothetical protein n=1 Tax=uncultured Acetobacteroides sp. TaxID=1760811 RepID=UPI0029F55711|nr:hypothetical protein [uncultured Acetobacteroides sp.]
MRGILGIALLFLEIKRITTNIIKPIRLKRILKKLETDLSYRTTGTDEIDYLVGKDVSSEYSFLFIQYKKRIANIKTPKFDVRGVFDLNPDSFLVVVLCNDSDLAVNSWGGNTLERYVRILYFKVNRNAKESRVEMYSFIYNDLSHKNTLEEFYNLASKHIKEASMTF